MEISIDECWNYKKPVHIFGIDDKLQDTISFQIHCDKDKNGRELLETGCYLSLKKSDIIYIAKLLI